MGNDFFLYIAIGVSAIISVIVWLDYFRRIDVFEPEKITQLTIALLIGCITPVISLQVYALFNLFDFHENGELFNDLIYSIFGIGLNEELCKIAGAIIAFKVLKKHINESTDYLIYAAMVALGFALVENFLYIKRYGIDIITTRSFYSVLEHIINTTIITYGYFRFKIFKKGNHYLNTVFGVILAMSSHGLFDYFIINKSFSYFSPALVITVYLIGINFWITMLNNSINFSRYFDYARINYPGNIFYRLVYWYFLTMLIGLVYKTYEVDIEFAVTSSFFNIFSHGFLFLIVIMRASRFKIYKNYYQKITIQLPFYFTKNGDEDFNFFGFIKLKVRGENSYEHYLTSKMNKQVEIYPINVKKSFIHSPKTALVEDKLFVDGDTTIYRLRMVHNNSIVFLKPKTSSKVLIDNAYPINSLLTINKESISLKRLSDFTPREWVFVKADNEVSNVNY